MEHAGVNPSVLSAVHLLSCIVIIDFGLTSDYTASFDFVIKLGKGVHKDGRSLF
jgi:hypothetical protein